jgi:hypothetical protein
MSQCTQRTAFDPDIKALFVVPSPKLTVHPSDVEPANIAEDQNAALGVRGNLKISIDGFEALSISETSSIGVGRRQ